MFFDEQLAERARDLCAPVNGFGISMHMLRLPGAQAGVGFSGVSLMMTIGSAA